MTAKIESLDQKDTATPGAGRWAFLALLAGNISLSIGALLVRLADTGPTASAISPRNAAGTG